MKEESARKPDLKLVASDYHTAAIKNDGTLWTWGRNNHGQLGIGSPGARENPTVVDAGSGLHWVSVSTGDYHTVAIKNDGTLWAWGWNNHGQLGNDSTTDENSPIKIGVASNWVSVSGGDFFSIAINENDQLWAWGDNEYGQVHAWVTEPELQP